MVQSGILYNAEDMNNPIIESISCSFLAIIGWGLHQMNPGQGIMFQWLHEILQDGAWVAAIILGTKAVIDFIKKRKKK